MSCIPSLGRRCIPAEESKQLDGLWGMFFLVMGHVFFDYGAWGMGQCHGARQYACTYMSLCVRSDSSEREIAECKRAR